MTDTNVELLGVGSRINHPAYGHGVVIRLNKAAYDVCFMDYGVKMVAKDYTKWIIIESVPAESSVTFTEAERSLMKILRAWSGSEEIVELGDKWVDGMLILKPKETDMKSKEIPIDTFFHKIVMVRDRIRVMEQRINASKGLNDEEKVNLQQYITRIYGSLTTFNVLFKYKNDHFIGAKS